MRKPNTCCYSRLGRAKARYVTRDEAAKALREAETKRRVALEVYECEVTPGVWHLRKARA